MAIVTTDNAHYGDIAAAIREKTGQTTDLYRPSEMAAAIMAIQAGGGDTSIEDGLITGELTEYTNNRVTTIRMSAFLSNNTIKNVTFPAVTSIGSSAFSSCYALRSATFQSIERLSGSWIFQACANLDNVSMPNLLVLSGSSIFQSCTYLTKIDFPCLNSITSSAFANSKIKSFVFRTDTVCTLSSTSAFSSTPVVSGTGYIYVPSALVEDYKAATNWSTYADQIRAIEDYTVDGTLTGDLDPTKTGA